VVEPPDDDLQLLAVLMMDVRATVDSMRRSITNTQSSIEQFRHTHSKEQIDDVQKCLEQLTDECRVITEAIGEAKKPLKKLGALAGGSPDRSGSEYTDRRKTPR
jgi:septal ring factor EnvC (AmiA/AmiB activator)